MVIEMIAVYKPISNAKVELLMCINYQYTHIALAMSSLSTLL